MEKRKRTIELEIYLLGWIFRFYNRVCCEYKKDKNGMLIIDEENANFVRGVFDEYIEGYNIGGIMDKLE